jgi:hypothetical protein
MKRLSPIVGFSFLGLVILSAACGAAEWSETYVWGHGYKIYFKMPKPFTTSEGFVELKTGRTPFEKGYVTEGDEDNKFQVRTMEMPVGAWEMEGFNPRQLLELALDRENAGADKMLEVKTITDPNWPENVNPAEEFTIVSADGKTIRHTRILVYEARGQRESYACYVLLTASRPENEPRSPDVDRFFNSLRICTDDHRSGRC